MHSHTQPIPPTKIPDNVAGAALRTVFTIFQDWQINDRDAQILLGVKRATYYRWKSDPASAALSQDTLERISYIFGIYKALQILLPDSESADTWIQRPNDAPLFNGHSALEIMRGGRVVDLYKVRQYLDAVRGG